MAVDIDYLARINRSTLGKAIDERYFSARGRALLSAYSVAPASDKQAAADVYYEFVYAEPYRKWNSDKSKIPP